MMNKFLKVCLGGFLLLAASTPLSASEVSPVLQEALPPLPADYEVQMLKVTYGPGEYSPPHRHNAYTFVYVLTGTVTMQVEGQEPVTLYAGETFRESPTDIHTLSKNASDTQPAVLLVWMIKPEGQPPTLLLN